MPLFGADTKLINPICTEPNSKLNQILITIYLHFQPHLNWFAWFLKCFIYLTIITLLMLILLTTKWFGSERAVLTNSSFSLLFVFFLIYCVTSIIFVFMLSTFFNNSGIAAAVTAFIFMLTVTPYIANSSDSAYAEWPRGQKLLFSSMLNYGMSLGMRIVSVREVHDGVHWHNMNEYYLDDISFAEVTFMLAADAVLYLLIISVVKLVSKLFRKEVKSLPVENSSRSITSSSFLKIHNLTKFYSDSIKPAVEDLNLSLNENQITVLLGVNGAGKSTTMSILCGAIKPTAGTAYVNGKNLVTSNGYIQYSSTGVAFQENVLFDKLTVREHLLFYGQLKGNSLAQAETEVIKFTTVLNLNPDDYSCNLSGGMKRKLCMAMALCANSMFVILDEISSGVDPSSRREIWTFLQSMKRNRVVLMSTHFMLEAEVVADKIAVLCDGKLKAEGTPFDLKQKFSKTCSLICVKKSLCDTQIVADFVRQFIPLVRIGSEVGLEIIFEFDIDQVGKIHEVLRNLEENMDGLNLESFGIALASMDEVIDRIGIDEDLRGSVVINDKWIGGSNNDSEWDEKKVSCEYFDRDF